jgi:hypothetical protein
MACCSVRDSGALGICQGFIQPSFINNSHKSEDTRHGHNNEEYHHQVKEERAELAVEDGHEVKHQIKGNVRTFKSKSTKAEAYASADGW